MKEKMLRLTKRFRREHLTETAEFLLRDEAISGKLILVAAALALIIANSPLASWYESLLYIDLRVGFDLWNIELDLKHWISEGLMLFFFLVVGLELKRELVRGEFRDRRAAILPVGAAIGGMLAPALLFLSINAGSDTAGGWAVPIATDIALAVGILGLVGNKIPKQVRIFLLALAIVDDILAVLIIALFFNTGLEIAAIAAIAAIALQVYILGRRNLLPMWGFILSGILLWLLATESGVHPSIVGVILGFIAPMASHRNPGMQIAERAERSMIPFSTLFVVPVFAFANTGISFDFGEINYDTALPLGSGIILGLVVGKLVGIFGMSWLLVKIGLAQLPERVNWAHVAGVGLIAGIGFTVSIFVTDLAFSNEQYVLVSKISIFIASAIAAIAGLTVLKLANARR